MENNENAKATTQPLIVSKPRRGRPPKALVEQNKKPGKGKVGRPAGTAARIEEFKARLLSTKGTQIIDRVLSKALDDEDKDQVACLKMCLDRMLPLSHFEKAKGGQGNVSITITTTSGDVSVHGGGDDTGSNSNSPYGDDDDVIDMEYIEDGN